VWLERRARSLCVGSAAGSAYCNGLQPKTRRIESPHNQPVNRHALGHSFRDSSDGLIYLEVLTDLAPNFNE